MKRTTLPHELEAPQEQIATGEGGGEVAHPALTLTPAVHSYLPPRLPLFDSGDPTLSEQVDEGLACGFGE